MIKRIVYGVHPVEEVLRKRPRDVKQVLVSRERELAHLLAAAKTKDVPSRVAEAGELDSMCGAGANHQGAVAIVGEFIYCDLEDVLENKARKPLLLAIDEVTDPQNLGSMIRSALVLGATGVIIPKDRCVGITPAVVRVSAGASEYLPCAQVTNLRRALEQLKEAGVWIFGTAEKGGVTPAQSDLTIPLALVMGSEGRGLRPIVLKMCDFLVTIPSAGEIASLNVAAATACVFYEAQRQRAVPAQTKASRQ